MFKMSWHLKKYVSYSSSLKICKNKIIKMRTVALKTPFSRSPR